ncbi:MAG TPA: PPC domain-containing protein, partial [Haliangiales bacterium]|nr:PPC domain-containing protein [Haliangiales bacterium]
MIRRAVVLLVLSACSKVAEDDDEPKLSRRSRDAGPAVVFVDRTQTGGIAAVEEKEPNDRKAGGQPLSLPGAVRGRIDAAGDEDAYTINVPRAGTLSVRLSAVEDADLILELVDAAGAVLATSDDGPAKTAEALPNVFVQPGAYQIVVHEFVKPAKKKEKAAPPRSAPSAPYDLVVGLGPTPEPGEERERNDEPAFADPLALGQAGRGFVGWRKDVDVWKISLDGARADDVLSVDVSAVPGVALRLALVDAAG